MTYPGLSSTCVTTREETTFSAMVMFFIQKTNLSKEGKKVCLFRCANHKRCYSSISLKTRRNAVTEAYLVVEPFIVANHNIKHDLSCKKSDMSHVNFKKLIHEAKMKVAENPLHTIQNFFERFERFQ